MEGSKLLDWLFFISLSVIGLLDIFANQNVLVGVIELLFGSAGLWLLIFIKLTSPSEA